MTTLNDAEIAALHQALADEHHAWATYDQVIHDFGLVRPFSNIRDAEVANAALHERLLASTDRSDILAVFRNLRDASQQRHLPAFRRCVERRR
jgi:hypothetical protein